MTFEEAMERLNCQDVAAVAFEMIEWHPVILGNMILAIAAAKRVRYRAPHPDYGRAAAAALKAEFDGKKHMRGNTMFEVSQIRFAAERIEQALER
jgi:hypothetical protein